MAPLEEEDVEVMFAVTFNPKLPSIANIIGKHWRTMTRDTKLKNTFPEPPMVAYKQPPNIRKILCRAKLPPKAKFKPDRKILGMKKCGKPCIICDYMSMNQKKSYLPKLERNSKSMVNLLVSPQV